MVICRLLVGFCVGDMGCVMCRVCCGAICVVRCVCCVVFYGIVWYGMAWYAVWYCVVWYGMVLVGMVLCGTVCMQAAR